MTPIARYLLCVSVAVVFYLTSFFVPALSDADEEEKLYGWQVFVYSVAAFPIWVDNLFFVIGTASVWMRNIRLAEWMFRFCLCCGVLGYIFMVGYSDFMPLIGFYLWLGSFAIAAAAEVVKW